MFAEQSTYVFFFIFSSLEYKLFKVLIHVGYQVKALYTV